MASWSAADWREYGERVCGNFTERLQQFIQPAAAHSRPATLHASAQSLSASAAAFARPSLPKDSPFYIERKQEEAAVAAAGQHEADEEAAEDDECMAAELSEAEELELRLLVASFTREVTLYLDERLLLNIGMDERVLLALRTLNAVCKHVLSHGELLSLDAEIGLLALFPDIAAVSNRQLTLWLEHQKAKLATLLTRVIGAHSQHAAVHVDESTPFAASVLDNFTILSATVTGYFEHLDQLAPFVSPRTYAHCPARDTRQRRLRQAGRGGTTR